MNKKKMDTSDIELMRTEIEILKICQHPNIIRLYDIFENIDYIYIIMEYCPGGDLFSYLEKRKFQISEERAAVIMNKMCEAVFYFQSYFGVIHRDLKPENVLMTSDGDDGDIRILDFGLSKISTPNEKCTEPYGTLTYCAPEIILDEPYNKEVDMWSLGIMTYLMVSGRLPFNAEDENKIARQIAFSEPDFENADCWKKISKECVNFIKKLLEKDPKKRMLIGDALKHEWFKKFIKKK
jgi:calcium-dependent protein kinase